jgi:uncharacterized protein (TIGR03643 family)
MATENITVTEMEGPAARILNVNKHSNHRKEAAGKAGIELTEEDIDRIIEMAWEDRTPFDAIRSQFGLEEAQVKALMKKELRFSSYTRWRTRVENCATKHARTRSKDIDRFRCSRQRSISFNKISKR